MVQYRQSLLAKLSKIESKKKGYFMKNNTNTSRLLQIKSIILFIGLVFSSTQVMAADAKLLIKSSFDGVSVSKSNVWEQDFIGTDSVTGYTWPNDLPGDTGRNFFNYVINDYTNYLAFADAKVVDTTGYNGASTKALYIEYKKDDPTQSSLSRVQYVMWGLGSSSDPVERLDQGYVKYRIKAHIAGTMDWWMPIEWKQEGETYRVSLYAYKTNTATPYWYLKGEVGTLGGGTDWAVENHDVPVPQDEWYTLECFWVGDTDPAKGRMKIAINGQVIFDVRNRTKNTNNMYYFSPFKIYGSAGYSWITDFEMWDMPPVTSVLSDNYQPGITPAPDTTPVTTPGSFVISPGVLK